MATSEDFKNFVLECLKNTNLGFIFSARKMFGNYCIYVHLNEKKPLFLLCDERLFIKCYEGLETLLDEKDKSFEKAKDWYVVDFENLSLLEEILEKVLRRENAKI
ncbi:competence protein TfoX [Campylobacter vulpis]|uniref:Competence protein TfoX n=1 Tax=Campylobacter vulpis TaxID=1655500 RepID=A0A2G4R3H9_9BACT|nr:competence protein TfoX [Campylobacter vulpis]MBS4241299.1 competence protein TfoX [Campylobacter vulpis]MBS4252768.1 competence protein TfoX [Campylobacter vulpis]MBS4282080.1 competence protein TfoX [Campylobacter vulpis]MBS4332071.1 competence protein TfoX [Campylobacter vulpis]MBS4439890.1 competence protein TfoX [Campylobacter vulpis]